MESLLTLLQAVILGVVEGITEFLPISSTGHMILVGSFMGIDSNKGFWNLFEIVIQFGAILSVVVLYRRRIWDALRHLGKGQYGRRLALAIIAALIPCAVIAKLFYKDVGRVLSVPLPVSLSMVAGGVLLILCERYWTRRPHTRHMEQVSVKQGFVVGLFQCISFLWPGFSRSAATIMGGWAMGMTTVAAADFTFFLAIPTMLGASAYSLADAGMKLTGVQVAAMVVGFVVSFIVALVVVKSFIGFLKKKPLRVFGVYRIVAGVILLLCIAAKLLPA